MAIPDRVAFTLFGRDIYWYGVLMAVGIVLAVLLAMREEKRKKLQKDIIIDLCLVIIPSGVIGARLYYVLFHLDTYLADPISILYIWNGGLAIYGAVIFGFLGAFVFSRIRKVRFLKLADCIVPGLVLAQAIGRWGNFFNQEAFGLPVTPLMIAQTPFLQYFPFSVGIEGTHRFNEAVCTACVTGAGGVHLHLATFFYESVWCLLVFLFVWLLRKRFKHDGDALLSYAGLYALERMFVERLRGDSLWLVQPGAWELIPGGIRVSELVSIVLVISVAAFLIVRTVRERKLGRLIWPSPEAVVEAEDAPQGACECGECSECAQQEGAAEEPADAPAEQEETEQPKEAEESVESEDTENVESEDTENTEETETDGEKE